MIIGNEKKSHRRDYRLVNFYEEDGTVSSMWVKMRHPPKREHENDCQYVGANFL